MVVHFTGEVVLRDQTIRLVPETQSDVMLFGREGGRHHLHHVRDPLLHQQVVSEAKELSYSFWIDPRRQRAAFHHQSIRTLGLMGREGKAGRDSPL